MSPAVIKQAIIIFSLQNRLFWRKNVLEKGCWSWMSCTGTGRKLHCISRINPTCTGALLSLKWFAGDSWYVLWKLHFILSRINSHKFMLSKVWFFLIIFNTFLGFWSLSYSHNLCALKLSLVCLYYGKAGLWNTKLTLLSGVICSVKLPSKLWTHVFLVEKSGDPFLWVFWSMLWHMVGTISFSGHSTIWHSYPF